VETAAPHGVGVRWARAYFVAGAIATGVYFALPRGSDGASLIYVLVAFSSVAAIEVGLRLHRPRRFLPWHLFALGLALFAVGDALDAAYEPRGTFADDGFYLAGYLPLAAGLGLVIARLRWRERRAALAEATVVAIAFALAQWVFAVERLAHGHGLARVIDIAYPTMDVLLLAGLAGFLVNSAWRTEAYGYLTAAVVLVLVGDEVYLGAGYGLGHWVDAFWLLSYSAWGAAALAPSMRTISDPPAGSTLRLGSPRLALLGAALLTAPAVLLVQKLRHAPLHVFAVVAAAAALSLVVLARLGAILRSLEAIRTRERRARADAAATHRRLVEQNERLVQADRLKDEFVALISHDLRTPLTSIMGFLELVLDPVSGPLNDDQRAHLEVVLRNSNRLLALVNDLLFVARLQAGQLDLEPSELDLAAVVRQSIEEARPGADARGVAFELDAVPVPLMRADRGRIFQLLDNLISNAIKFTPRGGSVRVALRSFGGDVFIEIADTGIGIPAAEVERLFERFFRASTAVERQIPGTGLGLYIARAIVEAHGGTIRVESKEGTGTMFKIDLPGGGVPEPAA
jgi:signal transduction histidine kinase